MIPDDDAIRLIESSALEIARLDAPTTDVQLRMFIEQVPFHAIAWMAAQILTFRRVNQEIIGRESVLKARIDTLLKQNKALIARLKVVQKDSKLRDSMAIEAMKILTSTGVGDSHIPGRAYKLADAMIKERCK